MSFNLEFKDLVFDQAALTHLLKSPQGDVGRHIGKVARDVEAEAKRLTNNDMVGVVTGRLSGSQTHVVVVEGGEVVGYVGTNVQYAPFVHDGARGRRGRPWLTVALETVLGQ